MGHRKVIQTALEYRRKKKMCNFNGHEFFSASQNRCYQMVKRQVCYLMPPSEKGKDDFEQLGVGTLLYGSIR